MSCERNRGAFVAHVSGSDTAAAQAFGGPNEASAALETIFDTARAQAATESTQQQQLATAKTRLLFDWMKKSGFTPPTHSKSGLPKADAQFGYAALYDTLAALRDGKPLPTLAAELVDSFGQDRALGAVRLDEAIARMRCGSCGRFAPAKLSRKPPHVCPNTATPQKFQRALTRRLGVSAAAYPANSLSQLLDEARSGGVMMRHPITGEPIQASLDGLPLALTQGYVPESWRAEPTLALVEVSHGRIAPVLDATGLAMVKPSAGAVSAAAAASGAPIPSGTPHTAPTGTAPHSTVVLAGGAPSVTGGSTYDLRRFLGTEFRKAKGQTVVAIGKTYTVGDRSFDSSDWAYARHKGVVAPPPGKGGFGGIAVGRTLVAATEYLRTGSPLKRSDGVIELYNRERELIALYDPATRTAGDIEGIPNASAAQMAAVLAAHLQTPSGAIDDCFDLDIYNLISGATTSLAASDGAYLVIKEDIERNGPLTLGGAVSAAKCPTCGKFMGADGCLASHATSAAAPAPAVAMPVEEALPFVDERFLTPAPVSPAPVAAVPVPPVTVRVDAPQVSIDAPQITVEPPQVTVEIPQITVEVEAPQVTLDADAIARGVAARMPISVPAATDGSTPTVVMPAPIDERVVAVLDGMLDRLERMQGGAGASGASATSTRPARSLKPRADRPVPKASAMTEQEKVVTGSALRLPRPDRELTALDRKMLTSDFAAVDEDIPAIKAEYAMNATERMVMQRIVSTRAVGLKMGRVNETRSFGIYGPPGTGKNELARQLAASLVTVDENGNERQGVHMEQVEFDRDMDTGALIGTTALENGSTVARLGPIGLAAVQGSVICLNEVVRNPKALTQFQSMLEEGEIRLKTPEAGIIKIPIHPATTFVLTWNPGLEGDSDRPAEAPRSRIVSFELPAPTAAEQAKRVASFFAKAPEEIKPTPGEVNAAVSFFGQLRTAINQGKMQQRGRGSKAVPGPRDLNQFLLAGKTDGWPSALAQMKVFCDQNVEDRDKDWKIIEETFSMCFGSTGR